jgi:cysteine-rich repeat protein
LCSDSNFCNGAETCGADHRCHPATNYVADGTVCGAEETCQAGECQPAVPYCGDKLVVGQEECDPPDGKGCTSECRFACVSTDPSRDCTTADVCAGAPKCDDSTHVCVGHPLADGTHCGPNGRLRCVKGVCTDVNCGNGRIDQGEECDDGNNVNGDGCDHCLYSCVPTDPTRDCHSDSPCVDGGTCNTKTHKCPSPTPKAPGVACGANKNCIAGNCLDAVCGDGVVALGTELCDDGNTVQGDGCDGDCRPSCTVADVSRCSTVDCRVASCASGTCTTRPDASANGHACQTGAASATCNAGACTAGTCGNGTVEAGEQCDLGAGNGRNAGCETNCTFSCSNDTDCDDHDPCDGTETCSAITGGKLCKSGTPLADGTACPSGRICLSGGCRIGFCGDGYTDSSQGEECDPPNPVGCSAECKALQVCDATGAWAAKIVFQTSFGDGQALATHSGPLYVWAKLALTQSGRQLTGTIQPCGLIIPDFQAGQATGSEWYGLDFPDAIWAHTRAFPVSGALSNSSPGATLTIGTMSLLYGVDLTNPLGSWPSAADLVGGVGGSLVDDDADGAPGITVLAKTGPIPGSSDSYSYPIVNLDNIPDVLRAKSFDLAIRALASVSGRLDTCTGTSGRVGISAIDDHVVACTYTTGGACAPADAQLADLIKPIYTVTSATYLAQKVQSTADCAAVRAAVP